MEAEIKRIKIHSLLAALPWSSSIKALRYALRGHVEKHVFLPSGRYFYIVRGSSGSHVVSEEGACSCLDYYLNVVMRGRRAFCHHFVSVVIARELGKLRIVEHKDQELPGLLKGLMSSEGMMPRPDR
ncbi:MAG: hypothetical protein BA066_02080 [Candidatus Korarchaeota archaeon NZ13-K]|nr:MAG: hypothetical protein BA066_02080 [Candidatus Korarchaeota archaeon NZ13-K]